MWLPQSAVEVVATLEDGSLFESETFDAKAEVGSKPKELAKDVAAMANDGGVLLYGVGEDDARRPTLSKPLADLARETERVSNWVRTCLVEVPTVRIRPLPFDDGTSGFLLVHVPQSPRAPHQVVFDRDLRFYERVGVTSVPMSEGTISRLYERRSRLAGGRDRLLDEALEGLGEWPRERYPALLNVVVRPLGSDRLLLERAAEKYVSSRSNIQRMLWAEIGEANALEVLPHDVRFSDDPRWTEQPGRWVGRLGWDDLTPVEQHNTINASILYDGHARLFSSFSDRGLARPETLAVPIDPTNHLVLLTRFLRFTGRIYDAAGFGGATDVGVLIAPLRGFQGVRARPSQPTFEFDTYKESLTVQATDLLERRSEVVEHLLRLFWQGCGLPWAMANSLLEGGPQR